MGRRAFLRPQRETPQLAVIAFRKGLVGDGRKCPYQSWELLLWKTLSLGLIQFRFREPWGAGYCHDAGAQAQISAESQQTFHLKLNFIPNVKER